MEATDVEEGVPDEDALPVCEFCLEPLPDDYALFCPKCRAPIEPLAAIIPFVRIFAQGFLFRRAAEQATSLLTVIGIWIMFLVPGVFVGIGFLSILVSGDLRYMSPAEIFGTLVMIPVAVGICLGISFRVTRSYLASRSVHLGNAEGPSDEGPSREI